MVEPISCIPLNEFDERAGRIPQGRRAGQLNGEDLIYDIKALGKIIAGMPLFDDPAHWEHFNHMRARAIEIAMSNNLYAFFVNAALQECYNIRRERRGQLRR